MKPLLNWRDPAIVNIYDEVCLWSAPFGLLMLEQIPMRGIQAALDLGFGTGFPLIELAQRLGPNATVYGMDLWPEAIARTREKQGLLNLTNIQIMEGQASHIPLQSNSVDLVTSNLGINNFDQKERVYQEVARVLKKGGHLCLTTNPTGTFAELYKLMLLTAQELGWTDVYKSLEADIHRRSTQELIIKEIEDQGFNLATSVTGTHSYRFAAAEGVLDHSIMRIAFRAGWEEIVGTARWPSFYQLLLEKIQAKIRLMGSFTLKVPLLYLDFIHA